MVSDQHSNPVTMSASLRADALVLAARQGQRGAFDRLVKTYRPRVYALALHMTGSASDADDVTQETFLQAYRRMDRFEGRSQFFTWLYRIALNQALSARRSTRTRSKRFEDARLDAALAVDGEDDPRKTLELREAYGLLLEALDALSPTLQSTVVLIALQGLSYREAAVVLNTEEGTIAWRVHEARRKLGEHIARLERPARNAQRNAPHPAPFRQAVNYVELLQKLASCPG